VTGSRLTALRALRDYLAASLDSCESKRDQAALTARLTDVLVQIDELRGGVAEKKKKTGLDEFTKRLNDRQQSKTSGARRSRGV
jgi:hypothetical protein